MYSVSLTCWKLREERREPTTNCVYRSGRISQETGTSAELNYGLRPVALFGCLSCFKVGRQLSRNAKGRAHMLALPCVTASESQRALLSCSSQALVCCCLWLSAAQCYVRVFTKKGDILLSF